jgi:hypothetical protein
MQNAETRNPNEVRSSKSEFGIGHSLFGFDSSFWFRVSALAPCQMDAAASATRVETRLPQAVGGGANPELRWGVSNLDAIAAVLCGV